MLFVSIFTSDRERDHELWATMWQGAPPPSISLVGAYNLGNDRRVFVWNGESEADVRYMDRFNEIGILETYPAFDRTQGWRMAFARDLEAWGRLYRESGRTDPESAIDLRRRAMNAPNRHAARAAARRWQEEQACTPSV